jgi:hypothetical protein
VKRCVPIVLACLAAASAAAQTPSTQEPRPWTLGGTLTTQPLVSYASDVTFGSASTLGLFLRAGGGRARAEASVEASVLTGASARTAWAIAASPFARADELLLPSSSSAAGGQDAAIAGRVRTLYAKLDLDWAALTAGRQVLNYGRGALWTPTDIFTELDLSGISPVRRGTDALRVTVPFDVTAGLDCAAEPTGSPGRGKYAARISGLLGDVDAAVMAARDGAGRAWLAGADFKADLVVGIYGDAIYAQPESGGRGFLRAAAGADWSFGDFVLAAEYYYNGGGSSADVLYPGAHNVYGSLTWKATELVVLSISGAVDVEGGAGTGTLLAQISAAQNADITAYVQAAHGNGGYGLGYGVSGAWTVLAGAGIQVKF